MEYPKKRHLIAKASEEPTKEIIPSEDEKGRKYEKIEAQIIGKWRLRNKNEKINSYVLLHKSKII